MATPKNRSTRRIMLVLYGTLFLLCTTFIVVTHVSELRDQRQTALARLGTVASSLASEITADHVDLLLAKYDGQGMLIKNTQDAWYYVMHDHLRKAAENNGLELPVRVLAFDSLKQELQIVATSREQPEFRARFDAGNASIMAGYSTGGRSIIDNNLLIAFTPLHADDGRTTGVIAAVMPLANADANAWVLLWRNIVVALVLFVLAGIALFRSVGAWVKQNELRHNQLEIKHGDITDSIAYAGKIQRALVPPPSVYQDLFDGSFVIDRPKDQVSGDFHWYHRTGPDSCFVAAADCTGHGLPGAMMAAIGCSLLNEIVPANADKDPGELLAMINTRLVATLHQQGRKSGAGDGMDIAICRVDMDQREILFAGANRPLYWLHEDQLTVINGDRRSVGGAHQELDRRYTSHRLAYTNGDRIYLFSDGYVDQFGGPERKRFMSSRLHAMLSDNRSLPMTQQAEMLERAFLEWKGNEEQVDDVCLLGLAV